MLTVCFRLHCTLVVYFSLGNSRIWTGVLAADCRVAFTQLFLLLLLVKRPNYLVQNKVCLKLPSTSWGISSKQNSLPDPWIGLWMRLCISKKGCLWDWSKETFQSPQMTFFNKIPDTMKITVFRRKKRKKHLLYFGRNYTIDFLSQALSPIPINSSEKKTKSNRHRSSFINQNRFFLIGFQWSTLSSRFFCWLIRSGADHWFFHVAFLLTFSIDTTGATSQQKCW